MKRFIILGLSAIALLTTACSNNREREIAAIENLRQELSPREIISDDPDVTRLLDLYSKFAAHFPDDSLAPIYLRDAADMNISIGNSLQAVELLDTVISLYPGFDDLGGCWFLKGYAFEMAELYDSARTAYTYFVDNFPEHVQAPSTRIALERNLIGASQEELINYLLETANDSNLAVNAAN